MKKVAFFSFDTIFVSTFVLLLLVNSTKISYAQIAGHCDVSIADKDGNQISPRTSSKNISFPNESKLLKISYYFDPTFTKGVTEYQIYGLSTGYGEFKGIDTSTGLSRYEQDVSVAPDTISPDRTVYNYVANLRVKYNGAWTDDYCDPLTLNRSLPGGDSHESCSFINFTVSPTNVVFTLDGRNLKPTSTYLLVLSDPDHFKDPEANFLGYKPFKGGSQNKFSIDNSAPPGNKVYTFSIKGGDQIFCSQTFSVGTNTVVVKDGTGDNNIPTFELCNQAVPEERKSCTDCLFGKTSPDGKEGIWTAIGCVPTSAQGIVQSLLQVGLGLSGGVVILTIIAGAFMYVTSSGDTKKVQEAQEMISSAVIGLLFVIFSVLVLQFIGVKILHIPGFGT